MSEFKGTPRPWASKWNSGSVDIFRLYPDGSGAGSPLAKVRDFMGDFEKTEANAHLIGAAPDLLEALQELRDLMQGVVDGDYEPDSVTLQIADAAIAKALGK